MSNFRTFVTVLAICCMMAIFAPDPIASRGLAATDEAAARELQTAKKPVTRTSSTSSTTGRVSCSMKTASGASFALDLARSATVRQAKFQIQRRANIRAERAVLSLNGVTLDDTRTVGSYNLQSTSTLDVKENTAIALPETVDVIMKTAKGANLAVPISKTATIREVKFQVRNQVGIDVDNQALVLNGAQLDGTRSVSYYNIQPNAAIEVKQITTVTPTQTAGVNGDPLIMGLSQQLFYFDGRSNTYYSAVSAPSLQWNMKITEYEGCPAESNTFVSGAGFTFFDEKKMAHQVEVAVINEQQVDVGCGKGEADYCLGAGSLQITINGKNVVAGGDYKLGSDGRIIAYNTFHQCARKWFDYDVKPIGTTPALRQAPARRLSAEDTPAVFDVINGIKDTMIDKVVCEEWLPERQSFDDLFAQPGHSSTIIIQTPDVNFHIEYRQESERCNAHLLDVWMSSVSPSLLDQDWEGIIGETKIPSPQGTDNFNRQAVLKHADDADYEVASAFATDCKGCAN